MTDKDIALFVSLLLFIVVPLSSFMAWRIISKQRREADQPMSQDGTGGTSVPVRQLRRYGSFLGRTANGINPQLALMRDGLKFKVFKEDFWAFSSIAEIDAPWVPFTARIAVRSRTAGRLFIDLADKRRARDFLKALPQTLTYTQQAIALRNSVD